MPDNSTKRSLLRGSLLPLIQTTFSRTPASRSFTSARERSPKLKRRLRAPSCWPGRSSCATRRTQKAGHEALRFPSCTICFVRLGCAAPYLIRAVDGGLRIAAVVACEDAARGHCQRIPHAEHGLDIGGEISPEPRSTRFTHRRRFAPSVGGRAAHPYPAVGIYDAQGRGDQSFYRLS